MTFVCSCSCHGLLHPASPVDSLVGDGGDKNYDEDKEEDENKDKNDDDDGCI